VTKTLTGSFQNCGWKLKRIFALFSGFTPPDQVPKRRKLKINITYKSKKIKNRQKITKIKQQFRV